MVKDWMLFPWDQEQGKDILPTALVQHSTGNSG